MPSFAKLISFLQLFSQSPGEAAEVHNLCAVVALHQLGECLQVPHRLVPLAVANLYHRLEWVIIILWCGVFPQLGLVTGNGCGLGGLLSLLVLGEQLHHLGVNQLIAVVLVGGHGVDGSQQNHKDQNIETDLTGFVVIGCWFQTLSLPLPNHRPCLV